MIQGSLENIEEEEEGKAHGFDQQQQNWGG